ncbi:TetR/AcrR family transcriptional regulator [Actinopolymorpha alba]|uniref:TetR/AcrR family transcriptional regulator n=1 Tax=Actinopolymorpha alba TaxID=533267 RepID=UPI0004762148|nr:TetR/AcrR family transcriptional regulator [Actinopolymorpha alba]
MSPRTTQTSDPARRSARAERILDAAADLLQRWGYRRVTVDDIAEEAGIGKGTIYLHWKTREALFLAVLQREVIASIDQLVDAIREDPQTALLHRLTRTQFLGVMNRPLLCALYTGDPQVLGKLGKALHDAQDPRHHAAFDDYLRLLVDHGLLRSDLSVDELSHAFHAVLHGFLLTDAFYGNQKRFDLERRADLLATTVRRAFEPEKSPAAKAISAVAPRAIELFSESADADRALLRRAYE